jgi:hypothetical protein
MNSVVDKEFILDFLRPKSSSSKLIRIGGSTDGAYLLPDDLRGISRCFSPGCKNIKLFEDELTQKHGISCHMCDYTSTAECFSTPILNHQTFEKKWLSPVSYCNTEVTLENWINSYCGEEESELLLQMDIEGSEYVNILATPILELYRFRIVVMELHNLQKIENDDYRDSVLLPFFKKLDKAYICIHIHPNNCSDAIWVSGTSVQLPMTLEITLLRKDRFGNNQSYPPQLPHPLDICNLPNKEPLQLSSYWTGSQPAVRTLVYRAIDKIFRSFRK